MIELIVRSSKTVTQRSAKGKMGMAFKGNADAHKSHSPCNYRLLSRRLLPHLMKYTEEEFILFFVTCLIHNQQSSNLATARDTCTWTKMGHFCAGVHGPTEWLRPSCSSAGAHKGPAARALGSFCAGVTSRSCAGAPAPGPCCMSRHKSSLGRRASCKPRND